MSFNDAFRVFPALETDRLRLDSLADGDAECYFQGLTSARNTPDRPPWAASFECSSVENVRKSFGFARKAWSKKARIKWALRLKDSNCRLVGQCELFDFDMQSRAELGYWLNPELHRRGLMTEAVVAVVAYAFDVMELHRIYALTSASNAASIAMLSKAGFSHEGLLRKHTYRDGDWDDTILMAKIR